MAYKGKGQVVNRTVLADVFGVALNTVDGWVRSGCPVVSRGSQGVSWAFNTADVGKWLRDRATEAAAGEGAQDAELLKTRKLSAETQLAELELAKAKGLVAPLDQVERMMSRVFAEIRAQMRNLPSRLVSQLIRETDERRFKTVLSSEIDIVLDSLSRVDLGAMDDEEDGQDDGPPESAGEDDE